MKKTNKFLAGVSLVAALMSQAKTQETNTPEKVEQPAIANVAESVTNAVPVTTNQVKQTAIPQRVNVVESNIVYVPGDADETNEVVEVAKPAPKTLRGVESNVVAVPPRKMGGTNEVVEVTAPATNDTVQVTAPVTNKVAEASGTTNTVKKVEIVVTPEVKALIEEVSPQIETWMTIKDGLPPKQLFKLCALMHMEPSVGTRDLSMAYWKAAEAGMDIRPFQEAYINRNGEQQAFLKACQEGVAKARIDNQPTFTLSGVMFDINSMNLVDNLLKFKAAKDVGKETVIIEGRPFSIIRTPAEMQRLPKTRVPDRIMTPYGTFVREK